MRQQQLRHQHRQQSIRDELGPHAVGKDKAAAAPQDDAAVAPATTDDPTDDLGELSVSHDDDTDTDDDAESDVVSKTRKELEDLDDLDV